MILLRSTNQEAAMDYAYAYGMLEVKIASAQISIPLNFWMVDGQLIMCLGMDREMHYGPADLPAIVERERERASSCSSSVRPDTKLGSARLFINHDTPDHIRTEILAAGWPLDERCRTQQTQREHNEQLWAKIDAELAAQRENREGGQRADLKPASNEPCMPTREQIYAISPKSGREMIPVRIKSTGFGVTDGMQSNGVLDLLKSQGATILYEARALAGGGFVGTITGGDLLEICYLMADTRWYLYLATTASIDDWYQEWWVSPIRYTALAASDIIVRARQVGYDRPPQR